MIFEDRFLFEDGVYWTYTTDEKGNIDRKDEQRLPSDFLRITKSGVLPRRPLSTTIKRIHTRIYLQSSNRFIHKHYMAYNLNPMLQSYCPAKFSTIAKYG